MTYLYTDSRHKEYLPNTHQWKPAQGLFNLKPYPVSFPVEEFGYRQPTMWRYREALPFDHSDDYSKVTLGEGMTPLVGLDSEENPLLLKLDYLMPTGSFKDRGAAVLIAKALELGVTSVIADSSGNAGTAVAAYCARANIECNIYVPSSTSEKKLTQIEAHGAKVVKVPGSREDTAETAKRAVESELAFYASHVYNPFFYEGTKTFAFEIWEQLHYEAPDKLILPLGNGTLVLGAYIGFKNLKKAGVITRLPQIVAVQAQGCAPIAEAYNENRSVSLVKTTKTLAEGIAIANPARGDQVLQAIKDTKGTIITAPEESIEPSRRELAGKGFYVEPTTAATYAAYKEYKQMIIQPNETVVLSLCGSGLKK
ncbi:threonine synthase [Halobacillus andaensis]|uniref:threonine synthase n=1 Tax=Halobacillus andaensis TaxID=1176239 RepID=UPI003D7614B3